MKKKFLYIKKKMNFKYRPEIDGLRAIAVLSVILYHAGFEVNFNEKLYKVLPGGFLGVDIFYVISGYLITYLILERIKNNSFSFFNFYERRARRLLPTLFVVIAISIIAGWIFMMPGQMKDLSGSAISSLFFLSNFWFWMTDNYFAETSSLKPLLHTWSLSIEEQFYLIFPPFLYFIYQKKVKNINLLFLTLIISSLIFASLGNIYFKNLNFYLLPSRIWELSVGVVLAYYHINKKVIEHKSSNVLNIFGIILILIPFFLFNKETPHPSIFTMFTIIGTAIIIFYNKNKDFGLVKSILSSKLFVGCGLISYSLYLWHFPVFAFNEIKSSKLSEFDKLESIFLVFILSILSYYIIEKPFRNRKLILKKYFLIFISTFFIVLLSANFYIYKKNGLPERYSPTILKLIKFNYDYSDLYEVGKCHIEKIPSIKKDIFKNCLTKKNASKKDIFLWGDSLAAHLYPGIKNKYQNTYNLWHRSAGACKPSAFVFNNNKKKDKCTKINKMILEKAISLKPDKIFLAGFWNKDDLINLKIIIEKLKENGINKIYLVGPSVRWHDPLPKILLKEYRIFKKIPKYLYDENHPKSFELDKEFNNFANLNSISYMSLIKILCKKNYKCLTKVGEEADSITNWDENHFTEKASKYIFSKFMD